MVTIVIVAVLTATVGVLFVKLLTIQEQEREEAYVREKLADFCGAYADFLSVGSSMGTSTALTNSAVEVNYRLEAGGVSLETGIVSRVAKLTSSINMTNDTVDLGIYAFEQRVLRRKISRNVNGDALLLPLPGDMVSCKITPLNYNPGKTKEKSGFQTTDAALGYLEVEARYAVENDDGEITNKTVTAGRVVRMWNRE